MQKRISCLVLVIIMCLGIASCKPKGPPTISVQPEEPIPLAISMPPLSAGNVTCPSGIIPTDGNVESVVWMVPDTIPNLEAVVSAFETQYPQIHVELYRVNGDDYFTTSRDFLAAGCAVPDVLNIRVELSSYYAAYGWLASLWNAYTFDEKEDWIQALRKSGRYAQELYSAPFSTSTGLLFYNADLFEKAGITPPVENENWTWEKVAKTAQQLTLDENKDGIPETWGFAWEENTVHGLLPLVQSLGGEPIGSDGITVKGVIDSTPWVDAFSFYAKVYNEWKTTPKDDTFDATGSFLAGNLAMMVGNAEDIHRLTSANFSWGVSGYPYFKKGKLILPTGDWQVGINLQSTHYDAAITLLKWLTTKAGGEILWLAGAVELPAEKTVLAQFPASPRYSGEPNVFWLTAASEALVFTPPGVITPFFTVYQQRLEEAFREIRNGVDPQTTLSATADVLSSEMK